MLSPQHEKTLLSQEFTFWVTYFKKSKDKQLEEFEDNLKQIANFSTADDFWTLYERMKRPSLLPRGCEFFLFKTGIKPLWGDVHNLKGGRFFISMKKTQVTDRTWEDLLIGLILAGQSQEKVNGVVLNVRQSEVIMSVWTKPLSESEKASYLKWLNETLLLSNEQMIDYKNHPNSDELIEKQERLIIEENERVKKKTEAHKKKTFSEQKELFDKSKDAEKLAKLIIEMDEEVD